jgi:CRISPR/Cas system-associated protein Csx1
MGQIIKDQKDMNKKISYEDISTDLENNPMYSYSIESEDFDSTDIIKNFLDSLDTFLKKDDLNDNELKLGHALQEIFLNYDEIFVGTSNNKFNKNIILLSLREMTNLSTKEIRSSIKKFKNIYVDMLEKMIKY